MRGAESGASTREPLIEVDICARLRPMRYGSAVPCTLKDSEMAALRMVARRMESKGLRR